jgi:hypothetical protein
MLKPRKLSPIKRIPANFTKEQRSAALTNVYGKIMLTVWDMAEKAGMTDDELMLHMSETVHHALVRSIREKAQ